MENELDEISTGNLRRLDYLNDFYNGNGSPGLKNHLLEVEAQINPRDICSIPLGTGTDGQLVEVRVGRYGPFLSSGERKAAIPEDLAPDVDETAGVLTLEHAAGISAATAARTIACRVRLICWCPSRAGEVL